MKRCLPILYLFLIMCVCVCARASVCQFKSIRKKSSKETLAADVSLFPPLPSVLYSILSIFHFIFLCSVQLKSRNVSLYLTAKPRDSNNVMSLSTNQKACFIVFLAVDKGGLRPLTFKPCSTLQLANHTNWLLFAANFER